jgi:hypothetical protein
MSQDPVITHAVVETGAQEEEAVCMQAAAWRGPHMGHRLDIQGGGTHLPEEAHCSASLLVALAGIQQRVGALSCLLGGHLPPKQHQQHSSCQALGRVALPVLLMLLQQT